MGCPDLEHRWGTRKAVHLDAQLICPGRLPLPVTLVDISWSGAYLRTARVPPVRGAVRITLRNHSSSGGRTYGLAGYVIRQDDHGLGVEWWNLPNGTLNQLFAEVR